jgi:putative signal transducing protein
MGQVTLTHVANELEASVLCGLLQSHGIQCEYRKTDAAAGVYGGVFSSAGPTEVLVEEEKLQEARELLLDSR